MGTMGKWPNILVIGDSLTQFGWSLEGGWVSMVANHFQRRADVINRGFSGYTTNTLGQVIAEAVTPDLIDRSEAVVLFIGANDSSEEFNTKQHVPIEAFKKNYSALLKFLLSQRGLDRAKLILVPPPPCDAPAWKKVFEERFGQSLPHAPKTKATTQIYYEAIRVLAQAEQIDFVDHWADLDGPDNFCDGLHFSSAGSQKLFQKLVPFLETRLAGSGGQFPDWKDMTQVVDDGQ